MKYWLYPTSGETYVSILTVLPPYPLSVPPLPPGHETGTYLGEIDYFRGWGLALRVGMPGGRALLP